MLGYCVFCGERNDYGFRCYCSLRCAVRQLQTLGALLHSTPQLALSVEEWHDLGSAYASDLEALEQYTPRPRRETLAVKR